MEWINNNKNLLFRLGLGGIFLAVSVSTWIDPTEVHEILEGNVITSYIGNTSLLTTLVIINDGLLFFLITSGKYVKAVASWIAIWMIVVIYLTGFWTADFIEHLAILALAGSYVAQGSKKSFKKR